MVKATNSHPSNFFSLKKRLLSLGLDNTLRIWDTTDMSQSGVLESPDDTEVMCMDYLTKFGLVCTGHENGDIYMWDIEIGTKVKLGTKYKTKNTICCQVSGSIGSYYYQFSSGYDGKIYVWEFTEKRSASYDSLIYPQLKMSFLANSKIEKENIVGQEIFTMVYDQEGCQLFAAGNSEEIYVINVNNNASYEYKATMKVIFFD